MIRTAPAKGVEGSYELVAEICGDTALMLAPRAEVAFGAFFSGRRSGDEALALNADAECAKRRALVAEWQRNLVLDTPRPRDRRHGSPLRKSALRRASTTPRAV